MDDYIEMVSINPQELFKNSSIAEIQNIQLMISNKLEDCDHQLRTLVRERHDNVIESAAQIIKLNPLVRNSINQFHRIQLLDEVHIQNTSSQMSERNKMISTENNHEKEIAVLIRIMMDINAKIWKFIEKEDFFNATRIYLLSQYIYTHLTSNKTYNAVRDFPIIIDLHVTARDFPNTINDNIKKKLAHFDKSVNDCLLQLGSLAILKRSSALNIFEEFLICRFEVIKNMLNKEHRDICDIKTVISDTFNIVISTLQVANEFIENKFDGRTLFANQLNNMLTAEPIKCIRLIDFYEDDIRFKNVIPKNVQEFQIKFYKELAEDVCGDRVVKKWIENVKNYILADSTNILKNIPNIPSLSEFNEDLISHLKDPVSNISKYLQRGKNLWIDFYQPLIINRANIIISKEWENLGEDLRLQIKKNLLSENAQTECREANVYDKIWDVNLNESGTKIDLKLKFSENSADLCDYTKRKVVFLMEQMEKLFSNGRFSSEVVSDIELRAGSCCVDATRRLLNYIDLEINENKRKEWKILLLARYVSLIEVSLQRVNKIADENSKLKNHWRNLISYINETNDNIWKLWLKQTYPSLLDDYQEHLLTYATLNGKSKSITIQNNSETHAKNTEYHAQDISVFLKNIFFKIARLIGTVSPPVAIKFELVNATFAHLLNIYEEFIEKNTNSDAITNAHLLLDLYYILHALPGSEFEKIRDKCKEIINRIELNVDLLDLNNLRSRSVEYATTLVFNNRMLLKLVTGEDYANSEKSEHVKKTVFFDEIDAFPLLAIGDVH